METTPWFTFFSALFPLLIFHNSSMASEILYPNRSISCPETLVSADGAFELGFFCPGASELDFSCPRNNQNYYLGIWYAKVPKSKTRVVWVANRDYPCKENATLSISSDGNLMITDGRYSYKVTTNSATSNTSAKLLDSGNFILRDNKNDQVWWQSFNNPTDTILPGMKLGYDSLTDLSWKLVSWRRKEDPASGSFSLELDFSGPSFIIKEGDKISWNSSAAELTQDQKNWNRDLKQNSSAAELTPDQKNWNLDLKQRWNYTRWNYTRWNHTRWNHTRWNRGYLTYFANTTSQIMLDASGQLRQEMWSVNENRWKSLLPSTCSFHKCGAFSSCDESADRLCECLKGFEPYSRVAWANNDTSQGCKRITNLQCNDTSNPDQFYHMQTVSFPRNPVKLDVDSFEECYSACLNNCSCLAYALDADQGCFIWDQDFVDLKIISYGVNNVTDKIPDFYFKLAASEFGTAEASAGDENKTNTGNKKQTWAIAMLAVFVGVLTLGLLIHYAKRKLKREGEDLLRFDLGTNSKDDSTAHNKEVELQKLGNREVKFPTFSFKSVAAATENFSAANKLGEGGFGPVYKGKLLKGEEVAVKRLSKRSGQGWEELKNEAMLIVKLQHKNLVRLLGCCIEREEKILIYEYMPNKSLDIFLFDPTKRRILDWSTRVRIIEGVAHGLLYLHQYSRLQIIHRDLKASNILLDKDMNPKISDFGMARIFGGNESQGNTNRIVGTYGYMSPEYALEGLFSIKSDVFSFGVLLLEIVSGKKNTGSYSANSFNLLRYTWKFWKSERGLELMDPLLESDPSTLPHMLLRYVQIALLCVQECPADRPTMSDIVSMLSNESTHLPPPELPAFSSARGAVNSKLLLKTGDTVNNVTITVLEAR